MSALKHSFGIQGLLVVVMVLGIWTGIPAAEEFDNLPVPGKVTMIDLGAKKCVPCKMMAPILAKLTPLYKDRAQIVFIDVWQHQAQAGRFNIRAIPTQIFFDKGGKEIYRHIGFMGEADIVGQLKKMGVN